MTFLNLYILSGVTGSDREQGKEEEVESYVINNDIKFSSHIAAQLTQWIVMNFDCKIAAKHIFRKGCVSRIRVVSSESSIAAP